MEVSVVTVIGSCGTETATRSWVEEQEVYLNDEVAELRGSELKSKYSEKKDGNDYNIIVDSCCYVSDERIEDL